MIKAADGYFEDLAKGSDAHRAERKLGVLIISVTESTPAALAKFQPVYHQAREQASNAKLRTVETHWSSHHSVKGFGRQYDQLVIYFE